MNPCFIAEAHITREPPKPGSKEECVTYSFSLTFETTPKIKVLDWRGSSPRDAACEEEKRRLDASIMDHEEIHVQHAKDIVRRFNTAWKNRRIVPEDEEECVRDLEAKHKAHVESLRRAKAELVKMHNELSEHGKAFDASPEGGSADMPDCKKCKACHRWRGEGTIQFDFVEKNETQYHYQMRMDGPFAITFGVKDGTIQGEGTATLTLAAELLMGGESPGQCTMNGRDTVPMSVSGMYEDGRLKLMFDSSLEEYHITTSCSGKLSPAVEWFRSRMFVEALYNVFFDQGHPLVVVMEDGAEGRLVEDFSEPAEGEPPGMWSRIWSIRIKALQPEGEGDPAVSKGPSQSSTGFSGPVLPDY
jgi:hypothetical protein